jgi:lipoprotein-anchoring transpeptidase ErfK/SrfK
MHVRIKTSLKMLALAAMAIVLVAPVSASAAPSAATVREAQTIMKKFGLPTGAVDGDFGPQTARALCAFRYMTGKSVNRKNVDSSLSSALRSYNTKYSRLQSIPAPANSGHKTYLVAHETCQVMFYVSNGYYSRVMPISTAKKGKTTPNGTYQLGYTQRGWHCSTLYPESCRTQSSGRFKNISNYGNMYNKRLMKGNYFVHGSTDVPTYPASAGCIRVTIADSDWMYDNVGNNGHVHMKVMGAY